MNSGDLCPECGFSIAESLERRRLGLSSPAYLATLRNGGLLTLVACGFLMISGVLASPLLGFAFFPGGQQPLTALDAAGAVLLGLGVWMLTIDDPGLQIRDQARPNKRTMRAASVLIAASAGLECLLAFGRLSLGLIAFPTLVIAAIGLAVLLQLTGALMLCTGLVNYTRWLAVRVPDPRLLRAASIMGALLPVAVALAFMLSAGIGNAGRVLPLTLMVTLVAMTRERLQPDRMASHPGQVSNQ